MVIKIGHYLELLKAEAIKLLGSTKNKITKNENWSSINAL